MLSQAVRIDQDVIQIDYDIDVYHVREDVVHKSLKSCWCISKPFRHYQPFVMEWLHSPTHLGVRV